MYGCESLTLKKVGPVKNWCFQTVVLEKTLQSPLDSKEIKLVNPKVNHQPSTLNSLEGLMLKLKLQYSGHLEELTHKTDDGKDWGQGEKGETEDEMVRWHHTMNGQEFGQTPRDGEGQGSLVRCSPWCGKESDKHDLVTEQELLQGIFAIQRSNSGLPHWQADS